MKTLLFSLTVLILIPLGYGQAPSNDLIANATLVTSFPTIDILDITQANVPQTVIGGCQRAEDKVVYYKFTAANNGTIAVTAQDNTLSEPQVNTLTHPPYVTVYTAATINITDESQLTPFSICFSENDLDPSNAGAYNKTFQVETGTHYYIEVTSHFEAITGDLTKITFEEALPLQQTERDLLMDFYNATDGPNWDNNDYWGSTTPPGNWPFVSTHIINGQEYVTGISMLANNLGGSLPASLGNFSELRVFSLQANGVGTNLTGGIPPELGNLTKMHTLYIRYHEFLEGTIPPQLQNAVSLRKLFIEGNNLTGTIPVALTNLVNLTNISVNQNQLTGNIPIGFTTMPNLNGFACMLNQMTGVVPDFTQSPTATGLNVVFNHYSYQDVIVNRANNSTLPVYYDSPQNTLDTPITLNEPIGATISMEVTLTEPLANNGTPEFQWRKNSENIPNATENTYTIINAQVVDSGAYDCVITNNAWADFEIWRPTITLNVGNLSIPENAIATISIFPNPVTNILHIDIGETNFNHAFLFDISGRLLKKISLVNAENLIDMSLLPKGAYILKITNDEVAVSKRILKN